MPHNNAIQKIDIPTSVKLGQIPLTKFVDWLNEIDVKLLDWSEPKRVRKLGYIAQRATWKRNIADLIKETNAKSDEEVTQAILESAKGKSLPLNLEMAHFTFAVGGISRITTHQIVRNRIGMTYSQRCSGDQDIRHDDVLVPRDIAENELTYKQFKEQILEFKEWYATNADKGHEFGTHSIQTLRSLVPHCLSQFIIVHGSLLAFMMLIGKRLCSNETIEYNVVADRYRELIISKFPEFEGFLKANCDKGGCFFMKGKGDPMSGNIYLPDEKHDVFDYNKENFVYPHTRDKMVVNYPAVSTSYYNGYNQVDKKLYTELLKTYDKK